MEGREFQGLEASTGKRGRIGQNNMNEVSFDPPVSKEGIACKFEGGQEPQEYGFG